MRERRKVLQKKNLKVTLKISALTEKNFCFFEFRKYAKCAQRIPHKKFNALFRSTTCTPNNLTKKEKHKENYQTMFVNDCPALVADLKPFFKVSVHG